MSLFGGRQRYEAPAPAPEPVRQSAPAPKSAAIPQARTTASAQPMESEAHDAAEDLEIPSFLRRLAN
jgi:cell division protein FtsZ